MTEIALEGVVEIAVVSDFWSGCVVSLHCVRKKKSQSHLKIDPR